MLTPENLPLVSPLIYQPRGSPGPFAIGRESTNIYRGSLTTWMLKV